MSIDLLIKLYVESNYKILSGQYIVDELNINDGDIEKFFTYFCSEEAILNCNSVSLDWTKNDYELESDWASIIVFNRSGL